ncbi:HAD-superfamily hydrolase, subfamily IA, variant 3 [Beutenbergia cavernae DSM 12333]|uniref:HAD-superfamily hydrolase, subfamily IA, variant 3 n=1 Tax=Beutenbergia cavernae (strain ATCC BAA-8 / DSM 12333 / CCUG 43141 / JCM 11478 / NBRC 16432 / NCIMB 13614 / HKI 0122) TaxID=471853 RepID=C5BVA9_BEUC1|nr:HAD family phosphatase [Beutenbergia cavernae]ACQ80496.1 HAD-superfamily hydrolase, subfamily IA, variant 3 [Beutenbergia cavernae DSM 12333]
MLPNAADAEARPLPAAVLWDMDGTLVDTEPYWMSAEFELVAAAGGTWTHEDAVAIVGQPLVESAAVLRSKGGVVGTDEEIVTTLLERVVGRVRDEGAPWRPGARELLAELRAAGVPMALVTMSYRELADVVLAALPDGTFDAVVTGDVVTHGKPHPEPYLTAARLLGVDVADTVAVEDSVPGVASAEAAGARTIAVPMQVAVPAAPGRSRLATLDGVGPALLARVAAGEVIDTVGPEPRAAVDPARP